jgi:hypothetical protein
MESGASYIPVGLGVGRVFLLEKSITMNAFIGPQYRGELPVADPEMMEMQALLARLPM